jgi:hypothetical protein
MTYATLVLLLIENLAVSLLLMATIFALVGRFRRRWMGFIIWIPLIIFISSAYFGLNIEAALIKKKIFHDSVLIYFALILIIGYLVGVIWLCVAGVKLRKNNPVVPGSLWPLGKLSIAFILALSLHSLTIWVLDYQGRQQQALLRTKASILGLSIAPPRVPDIDNAAFLYERAGGILESSISKMKKESADKGLKAEIAWYKWHDLVDGGNFDPKDLELEEFLRQHKNTLTLILEATKKPDCYFEHEYYKPSIGEPLEEAMFARQIAGLLKFDALYKAANGDLRAALEDINAMFILARRVGDEPIILSTLTAAAIERETIQTLQSISAAHQIKPEELDIVKFNGFLSYQRLMQRAFHFEEAEQLNLLSEIGTIWNYPGLKQISQSDFWLAPAAFRIFFLNFEEESMRWYFANVENLISQPYYETKDECEQLIRIIKGNPKSPIVGIYYVGIDTNIQFMAHADAQHRVAELGWAMYRYRAKKGKYPENLSDLLPEYMADLPLDPFDGKPLRFKQTDGKIIIYSIGPDEIDDGGAPYDQETNKGDVIFELPNK